MDNKIKFQEMLSDILEVARVQGNQLEMNEIRSLFGDLQLSDEQYEHVFAYLAANQVKIKGYVETNSEYRKAVREQAEKEDNNDDTDEAEGEEKQKTNAKEEKVDSAYLKMYLDDISSIKEITLEEEKMLVKQVKQGDLAAKNRLIEVNLHYVVKLASEYKNMGITLEDLIQEGNIGLMCSLEEIESLENEEQIKDFITDYIKKSIMAAIKEQKENNSFENRVMEKAKYIRDSANELLEDLGREANIHELAAYVKMTEEEIVSILNMSADFVKIEKNHKH
jgi:RNA polymerase primary sigma factor